MGFLGQAKEATFDAKLSATNSDVFTTLVAEAARPEGVRGSVNDETLEELESYVSVLHQVLEGYQAGEETIKSLLSSALIAVRLAELLESDITLPDFESHNVESERPEIDMLGDMINDIITNYLKTNPHIAGVVEASPVLLSGHHNELTQGVTLHQKITAFILVQIEKRNYDEYVEAQLNMFNSELGSNDDQN